MILVLYSCGGGSGGGSDNLPQLDINYPPTISGEIPDIRVGETLSFTPITFDTDGDNLTFAISEKPDWLSFNASTGSLSGTAPEEALGATFTLTITVTDGQNEVNLGPLSFTVIPPIFFISLDLESMDEYRDMDFEIAACFANEDNDECSESEELITINANGIYLLDMGIKTGNSFEIKVDRDPARQECSLGLSEGVIEAEDIVIKVICQKDKSSELF